MGKTTKMTKVQMIETLIEDETKKWESYNFWKEYANDEFLIGRDYNGMHNILEIVENAKRDWTNSFDVLQMLGLK